MYVCMCICVCVLHLCPAGVHSYKHIVSMKKKFVHAPDMHKIAFRNDWCALNFILFYFQKQNSLSMANGISL